MKRELQGLSLYPERNQPTRRTIRLLRISITDRCNLCCRYCMPPTGIPKPIDCNILSLDELTSVAAWLCQFLEIERVKLTGGEPLVRSGVVDLVSSLRDIPNVREVTMTTNGTLLSRYAESLKEAGLTRVNVSLDSLDPERFSEITRGGELAAVLDGISVALKSGLRPLKLNAVLRRSAWQQDVPELLDFAASRGLEIRFIELMRTGTERLWCEGEYVAASEIQQWLIERGSITPIAGPQNGPARLTTVRWKGTSVQVGWITPRSHPFCSNCERLRLDAYGRVFRCLMDARSLPLASLLRSGDRDKAAAALMNYLNGKVAPTAMDRTSSMSSIGG